MNLKEIEEIYNLPFLELVHKAQIVHLENFNQNEVQASTLINIKSGGCVEDCSYCSQSVKNNSKIKIHKLMSTEEVYNLAVEAQKNGASRVCLGAAWREIRDNSDFDTILDMVRSIKSLKMEVCSTLGFVTEEQAMRLSGAGLDYYNHNIETSKENYSNIVTTHTFQDRLDTLEIARKAGMKLCSGGIIGMGESVEDRLSMILSLASMNPPPNSIPVNALIPMQGTPMEEETSTTVWDLVRTIATMRIVIPKSSVRLSAGRERLSKEGQALCFMAGANSVFLGEKLLTTLNQTIAEDKDMFEILGLRMK